MDWTWKKILILAGAALLLLILPLLLLCNGSMDAYQRRIDANPGSGFNRWLQMASADVCFATWRPERAAERYRKFMEHYPTDERRPAALLRLARSLEDADRRADALREYERFTLEYPDRESEKRDCELAIDRIKHVRTK